MRVFVICTGRSGSVTFYNACQHIVQFTAGHESRKSLLGEDRFAFPDQHIEVDNRLSWFLGTLNKKFGDEPVYVHLKRERMATAESYAKRFYRVGSIMDAFTDGIKNIRRNELNQEQRLQLAKDYTDMVTDNIDCFLEGKSKKMTFHLTNYKEDFEKFWNLIGAEGDYEAALQSFAIRSNAHKDMKTQLFLYRIKVWFRGLLGIRS